ncbi:ion channel [Jannaschia formosa]|uniref:ion channel n=1 Tax=Jannaschia formosa TaxID=2259592 RepID=UPI001FD753D5|nr:ion channel [Jannaschia formosa]
MLLLAALHIAAMVIFEKLTPFQGLWLTLTTMTTVGYGDYSAESVPGRISTIVLVFLGGIWIAFQSAATFFEHRMERRERMREGRWRWNMDGHILLLNPPSRQAPAYLARLVREFRASHRFRQVPVQIVSSDFPDGLPDELGEMSVIHFSGEAWEDGSLRAANAAEADVIVVLAADDVDPSTDGRTLDIVDRLRTIGAKGRILAECVDDANRPRFKRFGADVIVRPMRGYPEMIVRALAAPGAEAILEDMFTSRGDEVWRYDVAVSGCTWGELASTLISANIGVPIAYRGSGENRMRINPESATVVDADKLFVLVREGNARPDAEIAMLLKPICAKLKTQE